MEYKSCIHFTFVYKKRNKHQTPDSFVLKRLMPFVPHGSRKSITFVGGLYLRPKEQSFTARLDKNSI